MSRATHPGSGSKWLITLLVLITVLSAASRVLAQQEMTAIPMITGIEMLKVGDRAPDFTVGSLDGTPFHMNSVLAEKKGVLIFFWSIFCEPCKEELPVIDRLVRKYREKGFEFVGVVIDGSPMKDAISALIKQEKYVFDTLIDELNPDESFKVADPYGVAGTPTLYIIDGEGVIRFGKVGRVSEEELEKHIELIL